jgi:DNA-binding response OmpR family regulator/rhodanese-related sulfurtransferase
MVTSEPEIIEGSGGISLQWQQDPNRRGPEDGPARHALLANLRHELRNTLSAIIGFSEILLEDLEQAEGPGPSADLQCVNQAGKQILTVIIEVLDPGKIEAKLSNPDFQRVLAVLQERLGMPLSTLISHGEALCECAQKAERQNLADDLHIIYGLAKQLKEIVEQLIFPASVASMIPGNANRKPDKAKAIHEAAGIIQSMGSKSLPREAPQGCILVVDDDEANRGLLCSCLKRAGHTTVTAENGRQALDLLTARDFDLVLLDIVMPEMNGYQVLKQIRNTDRLHNVPVIMISAFTEVDSAVRCIEIGAEEYLSKPFDPNMLRARVKACLEKKMERDETVRELSTDLDEKASQLQATSERLGASRRKIELLEEKTSSIESAVQQEIEKIRRVSPFDILVIVVCGFVLGLVFNAANPSAVRLLPQSWSASSPPFIDLDSAKAKFDEKSVLFVDARPAEYYRQGHIPGAVSLPASLFDFVYMMKFAGTDPEREVIIYGRDISRLHDEETASRLQARGHRNISIMPDSLAAWRKRGYPLEE